MSSSQIALIYRELLPPTAITSSTFLSICTDLDNCTFDDFLITAGATVLSVYRVCEGKLKKVSSLDIFGKPQSLASVSLPSPKRPGIYEDHLLATFDVGKVVIAYFDCFNEKFEILQMNNFEDGAKGIGSDVKADLTIFEQNGKNAYPKLSIDPSNQLACTNVYGNNLVFLPLQRDSMHIKQQFIINLTHLHLIGSVVDQCFINGYGQPAVAILIDSSNGVPIGHAIKLRHTYSLIVLAIDPDLHTATLLWRADHLPNDALKVYPVSMTTSSIPTVLVVSLNALLMVNREKCTALSTNGFSAVSINTDVIKLHPSELGIALELNSSHWLEMKDDIMLGILKDGIILKMIMSKDRSGINQLSVIATGVKSTNICTSKRQHLLFLASRDYDSVLLGVDYIVNESPATHLKKRIKLQSDPEVEKEERELYGDTLSNLARGSEAMSKEADLKLSVLDKIVVMGPIFSAEFEAGTKVGDKLFAHSRLKWETNSSDKNGGDLEGKEFTTYIAPRELRDRLHICAGIDNGGSIRRMYLGLSTSKVTEKEFIGATSIKSVSHKGLTYVFMSSDVTRVMKYEIDENNNELVISEISKEPAAYVTIEKTIAVGFITDTVMVQVCEKGIRLISQPDETNIFDHFVAAKVANGGFGGSDSERIVSADILDGYVCAVTNGKTLYVHRFDSNLGRLKAYARANPTGDFKSYDEKVVKKEKENTAMNISPLFQRGVLCASLFSEDFMYSPVSVPSSSSDQQQQHSIPMSIENEEALFYGKHYVNESLELASVQDSGEMEGVEDGKSPEGVVDGHTETTPPIAKKRKKKKTGTTTAETVDTNMAEEGLKSMYLVAVDTSNNLRIVDLNTLQAVFTTTSLSTQQPSLLSLQEEAAQENIQHKQTSTIPYSKRQIKDIRMHRMGHVHDSPALTRVCILAIFETGDLGLYAGTEVKNGVISAFNKVSYSFAIRKRKARLKLRRGGQGDKSKDSEDVHFEDSNMYSVARVMDGNLNGYNGIIVSGPRPIFISSAQSSVYVIPLTFPELPHANLGTYSIAPFSVGKGSRPDSNFTGISSLWREFEDAGMTRNLRPCVLGIYKQIDNLYIHSGGTLSSRKLATKKTVHKCKEINNETQNMIEEALLKKKTHLLTTSYPIETAFNRDVQTPEEIEMDNQLYSRFFPTPMLTESCFQPNERYGPDPILSDRKYQLSLLQDGVLVDTWEDLEEGEMIVDSEILYLNQESSGGYARPETARVFIGVCTCTNEKNGDDSQGKGRLLLFGLSYSMFENSTGIQNDSMHTLLDKDNNEINKSKTLTLSQLRAGLKGDDIKQAQGLEKTEMELKKASQLKFLDSIQPKLKLLWSGYGPASIIKQFGRYVISTIGNTLYVYTLKQISGRSEVALEPVAFYTASFYIVDVSTSKDYIIISDAMHGTTFLVWRDQDRSLILQARDGDHYSCISSGLIRDGPLLGMIIADDEGNLEHLQYNPRKALKRLLCTADFHLGSQISTLLQHRVLSPPILPEEHTRNHQSRQRPRSSKTTAKSPFGTRLEKIFADRSCLLAGTLDGSIGMVVPVDERVYHRLSLLQQILCTTLHSQFGLNPREFRMFQRSRERLIRKRGVLDGNILWKFLTLDIETQTDICFVMGTTIDRVLDSLQVVEISTSFF